MRNKAYREKRTAWGDAIPLCILLVSELSLFSTFPLFKFDFLLSLFLHTFLNFVSSYSSSKLLFLSKFCIVMR